MSISKKLAEQIVSNAAPTSPMQKQLDVGRAEVHEHVRRAVALRSPLTKEVKEAVLACRELVSMHPTAPVSAPSIREYSRFDVYDGFTHVLGVRLDDAIPASTSTIRYDFDKYPSDRALFHVVKNFQALQDAKLDAEMTLIQYIRSHKSVKDLVEKNPNLAPFIPQTERVTALAVIPTDAMNMLIAK